MRCRFYPLIERHRAVVEGPDASWFFKLTGPKASLDSQRAAFEGMVKSLKRPG